MSSERREPRVSRVSRMGRFIRGRRPDRNPLRRTSDRVETAVLAALVLAFAVGGPFVALASGSAVHAIAHRTQLAQQSSRYQVTAVLLEKAPRENAGNAPLMPQVRARWWTPEGRVVTGEVAVSPGTAADTTVRVWITRDGQLTDAPLQDSQVAGQTLLAKIAGVVTFAMALFLTGTLVSRELNRRRMAAWDADWLAYGPRGTPRA